MNLRDLKYLVAIADHLNFSKAAEVCNISQPTLSMQLKKLEEYLGVQLIERTNKKIFLTKIGQEISERARQIVYKAEQLRQVAKNASNPLSGEITMGIFPTLAPYLLPLIVPKIKLSFPKITLMLIEEKTPEIIRQLESGKMDCALLAYPVFSESLRSIKLFTEPFTLAVPISHAFAQYKTISKKDLENEELLLLDEGHCLRDQALEVCNSIGIGVSKYFRATSLETLRQMVAAGNGITLIPKLSVYKKDSYVKYIPFESPSPSRTVGIFWRRTSARSQLFGEVANIISSVAKENLQ